MELMSKKPLNKLLVTGVVGTIIAALCCFTPILVIALGLVGLSEMVGYLDIVLLPALFIFVGMMVYALSKHKKDCCDKKDTLLQCLIPNNDSKKESCCSTQPKLKVHNDPICPVNDEKGQSVNAQTLRHLIKKRKQSKIKESGYYFCKTSNCDTVYFHPESGQTFKKSDLNIRVGLKESEDPVWVCYCFDISKKMIAEEIESTDHSASGDRIRKEVADNNCECEIKNPSGRCCLGEVLTVEKEAQKNLSEKNTSKEVIL
ncbi:MerF [hydrothermal vent metagenome]|uniref:MerF n=1 Tax=hydrothermal vent metagenome TaxID=652676 RepID=A0A3B1D5I7_9ZZZZ